jgi:cyclophilin family peptidyl-prolyl cis-trans isomerase/HEAT repeat protein
MHLPTVKRDSWLTGSALAVLAACSAVSPERTPADAALLMRILETADARPPTPDSMVPLLEGIASPNPEVRIHAVRALGRLERSAEASRILPLLDDPEPAVRAEAANALGQAVHGEDAGAVRPALIDRLDSEPDGVVRGVIAQTLGRLRAPDAEDVRAVATVLEQASVADDSGRLGFARAFYHLVRQPAARDALPAGVAGVLRRILSDADGSEVLETRTRTAAAAALMSSGLSTSDDIGSLLADPEPLVRREAVAGLATSGDTAVARGFLPDAMRDSSAVVRYEAVRAWGRLLARDDCAPIEAASRDADMHVALLGIDLLATCGTTPARVAWLDSVAASLPTGRDGPWHSAVHALNTLAILDRRGHARIGTFAFHSNPFVRAWAARVAAAAGDIARLESLVDDSAAIVRTAALSGLARTVGRGADPFAIRTLSADDGELLITAAGVLEGTRDTAALPALLGALERVTARRRETSRDPRRALLQRILGLGSAADTASIRPYLTDFDPVIADDAAGVIQEWTGVRPEPSPVPLPRQPVPTAAALDSLSEAEVVFEMADGGVISMRLLPWDAPTNASRLARLAEAGFFDGLTFHRVAPNFVVQGGSPAANEYAGDGPYTRDEVGIEGNWRGTAGLSTRGRDTGDGQIYFNLVDNLRLDHDYTVFAVVTDGMSVVDRLQEGAPIARVTVRRPR